MTQTWTPEGEVVPVTRVAAGPCRIVGFKTAERDGYVAVQIGFGISKNRSKAVKSAFGGIAYAEVREFRVDDLASYAVGDEIHAGSFTAGDEVKVSGTSKGKGFQGVVKRHHFRGHPATHGHKDQLRTSGAIGVGDASHVFKGKRMAGHMGDQRVTVKGIEIVSVDPEQGILFLKGAVPGARNSVVTIQTV